MSGENQNEFLLHEIVEKVWFASEFKCSDINFTSKILI